VADTSLERRSTGQDQQHHGAVTPAAAHPVVRYNPDAPSEEWGWHGSWRVFAPRGSAVMLWVGVVVLVLFNFTEHQSHVENYYFSGIALIGAIWLIARERQGRKMRRRQREAQERADH
jgi:hypothetical protein